MLQFDSDPIVYFAVGYSLLGILGLLAAYPFRSRTWWNSRTAFLALAFLALAFMRLPVLLFNQELNPDESQMIEQAMTLTYDPVFWRSVDGTTIGPLDIYLLIVPTWFGLAFDYTSARVMGLVLLMISFWLFFQTSTRWFGERITRLAFYPVLLLMAITQHYDLVHYSSEYLPTTMLAGLYYLVARTQQEETPSRRRMFLAGLLAAMIPYAKLQGVPMAFWCVLYMAVDVVLRPWLSPVAKTVRLTWLTAGGLSFLVLVAALTLATGVFDDMITFYFVGNFQYGRDDRSLLTKLPLFLTMLRRTDEVWWFTLVPLLLGLAFGVRLVLGRFRLYADRKVWTFLVPLLFFLFWAVIRTGAGYTHHLHWLVIPFGLLSAWFLFEIMQGAWVRAGQGVLIGGAVVLLIFVPYGLRFVTRTLGHQTLNIYPQSNPQVPLSAVSKLILQYAHPGEQLVVWGWSCKYHVETRMPQGVQEGQSIRTYFKHDLQKDYKDRYLSDMVRNKPVAFVDAVGNTLWLNDRATQGHESIPELKAYVTQHYRLVGDVDSTRVYIRTDRIRELTKR